MKLSICMMVKDEEKNLERCLKSIEVLMRNVESELIIVDTGSKDNTIEIAKKFTDKLYYHPWNDNFSEMRNITISFAKGEWVLIVDADEEWINTDCITSFLNSNVSTDYNSGNLTAINYKDFDFEDTAMCTTIRLFRNNGVFRYDGVVHNVPIYEEPTKEFEPLVIKHYGYIMADKELMERKFERTASLLKKELIKDPKNVYYRYQLSVSYIQHGDIKECLEEVVKAYDIIIKQQYDRSEYLYIYYQLAMAYFKNQKYIDSEIICKEGIELCNDHVDLYFCMAQSQKLLGKYDEAIKSYNEYLELLNNYDKLSIRKISSIGIYSLENKDDAYYGLAYIYNTKEKYKESLNYINRIMQPFKFSETINIIIKGAISLHKYKELKKWYDNIISQEEEVIKNHFETLLEGNLRNMHQDGRTEIISIFFDYKNNYGMLNSVRKQYNKDKSLIINEIVELTNALDFNILSDFYGDIIYYMIKLNIDISDLFYNIYEENINRFLQYITNRFDDFQFVINEYLSKIEHNDNLKNIKRDKILYRISCDFDYTEEVFKELFLKYIGSGIKYIKKIYNAEIIDNEMVHYLKGNEESLYIYMNKALQYRKRDEAEYIKYLRKSLQVYPEMKKGIEIILEEMKQEKNNVNDEFEQYKIQIKNTIRDLIDTGKLEEATSIINEYESIVKDDIEVLMLKSKIAVLD